MFYYIKQQVVQDFFQKGFIFLENGKTGFFSFLRVEEAVSMLKVSYQFQIEAAWLTVLRRLRRENKFQNLEAKNQLFCD